jgi:SAM-dependent methyltransferase
VLVPQTDELGKLYRARFGASEIVTKDRVWTILCQHFFARYVKPSDSVIDIAAGFCEFINHIECAEKCAFDMNPDVARFAGRDVQSVIGDCRDMSVLGTTCFGVAFVSNFFEHLESRHDIDSVLKEIYEHLRPGGRLLILQPNIRYVGSRYWDFYDHCIPLTHLSMREALQKNGFRVERVIPKFLPFTFKSRLPNFDWAVRAYLKFPLSWRLLGKQMFIVSVRPEN